MLKGSRTKRSVENSRSEANVRDGIGINLWGWIAFGPVVAFQAVAIL